MTIMLPGLTQRTPGLGISPVKNVSTLTSGWSDTDHYPGITTQFGGFTFTGAYGAGIRGTKAGFGRAYLEFTLASSASSSCGLANASADLSVLTGFDTGGNSIGYSPNGRYAVSNTSSTFAGSTYPSIVGSVIGVAYDRAAGLIWFNIGGAWVGSATNADPVASIGGIAVPPGVLFPAASAGTNSGGFFINTGSFAFVNSVPLTYLAWG